MSAGGRAAGEPAAGSRFRPSRGRMSPARRVRRLSAGRPRRPAASRRTHLREGSRVDPAFRRIWKSTPCARLSCLTRGRARSPAPWPGQLVGQSGELSMSSALDVCARWPESVRVVVLRASSPPVLGLRAGDGSGRVLRGKRSAVDRGAVAVSVRARRSRAARAGVSPIRRRAVRIADGRRLCAAG